MKYCPTTLTYFISKLRNETGMFKSQKLFNSFLQNNTTLLLSPLQLSSVNCFLESINDHLRLKDEKLALSISAQRVEGYEVERINEDIDKVK